MIENPEKNEISRNLEDFFQNCVSYHRDEVPNLRTLGRIPSPKSSPLIFELGLCGAFLVLVMSTGLALYAPGETISVRAYRESGTLLSVRLAEIQSKHHSSLENYFNSGGRK